MHIKLLIPNKKINFNYNIVDKYEAGIALKGNEVKNIVLGNGRIEEAFAYITRSHEIYLLNMYIPPFAQDSKIYKYNPTRKRKLLMHKNEIIKIFNDSKKNNLTIIAGSVYLNGNKIKVEICTAKRKNVRDKREDIKYRDNLRISKISR